MSRVHYSFQPNPSRFAQCEIRQAARMPLKAKMRDKRYLRSALETAGLFAFGFGSASLVAQLVAASF